MFIASPKILKNRIDRDLVVFPNSRYRAILHPLRPKASRAVILASIVAVWVASALLSLPALLYSTTLSNG